MSDVQRLSATVLHTVAEFLALLPADQLNDLAEGTARLTVVPKGADDPLVLVGTGDATARRASRASRRAAAEPAVDMSEAIGRLSAVASREEALALLAPMTVRQQLQPLASQLGLSGYSGYKKEALIGAIVEYTVGNRLNSGAIRQL